MFKKTIISAAIIAVVMGYTATATAEAPATVSSGSGKFGGGTIIFTGSVTEAPCSIPPGDQNQTVDLGAVSAQALTSGKGSEPVSIKINLKNCDLGTDSKYSKASLKFQDNGDMQATGKSKGLLNTTGSSDIAVQLLNRSNAPIDFTSDATMKPGTEVTLSTGADSDIIFRAHLLGTTGATKTPTAGAIKAQVSYLLDYH
ncbi:TPA: fimbrial protein [Salmonella enterica subsp. enterica serovar Paratyphi B]|nr:fimbrial protein [Salmonella enterica subsp. enterica serovar Paratyphi B]